MSDDDQKKSRLHEIDMRLGGLVGELGAALGEMLERLDSGGSGEVLRERRFETRGNAVRAETGIRIRVGGIAGETRGGARDPARPVNADPRGETRTPASSASVPDPEPRERAIDADILVTDAIWSLTADLPGVGRPDLRLDIVAEGLVVEARARGRVFRGTFDIPPGIGLSDLEVSMQNGILEIRAPAPGPAP